MEVVTPRPQLTIRIRENKHNPMGHGNHAKNARCTWNTRSAYRPPNTPKGTGRIEK